MFATKPELHSFPYLDNIEVNDEVGDHEQADGPERPQRLATSHIVRLPHKNVKHFQQLFAGPLFKNVTRKRHDGDSSEKRDLLIEVVASDETTVLAIRQVNCDDDDEHFKGKFEETDETRFACVHNGIERVIVCDKEDDDDDDDDQEDEKDDD